MLSRLLVPETQTLCFCLTFSYCVLYCHGISVHIENLASKAALLRIESVLDFGKQFLHGGGWSMSRMLL